MWWHAVRTSFAASVYPLDDSGAMPMREKEWDLLLQMLERQTCVLLLGTEFLPGSHTLSAAKLAAHLGTEIERPDLASHGLAHVAERYENSERFGRQDLEYEVGQFYQQPADIPDLMS